MPDQSPESYAANLEVLQRLCRNEGTDFSRIRTSHFMTFVMGRDTSEVDAAVRKAAEFAGVPRGKFLEDRGFTFVGTAAEAVDIIKRYQDAGVREMITRFPYRDEARSMRLVADEVMPKV